MRLRKMLLSLMAVCVAAGVFSCKREERGLRVSPPSAQTINTITMSQLQPGPKMPVAEVKNEYEENAYALSEGKTLYQQYNCVGCHFQGGGGIGPPLMDEKWIYGSDPQNIFSTIIEGRPNGMPSFRNRIPEYQVWQLVAYVRSMGRYVPKDVAPGRDDHMQGKPSEQSETVKKPVPSSLPKSAEQPQ